MAGQIKINVPKELHTQFKQEAVRNGKSMKSLIIEFIRQYIKQGVQK